VRTIAFDEGMGITEEEPVDEEPPDRTEPPTQAPA
jgi:hypothetical protein